MVKESEQKSLILSKETEYLEVSSLELRMLDSGFEAAADKAKGLLEGCQQKLLVT